MMREATYQGNGVRDSEALKNGISLEQLDSNHIGYHTKWPKPSGETEEELSHTDLVCPTSHMPWRV